MKFFVILDIHSYYNQMIKTLNDVCLEMNEKFSDYLDYVHKLRRVGVYKEAVLKQTLVYVRENKYD